MAAFFITSGVNNEQKRLAFYEHCSCSMRVNLERCCLPSRY